ncbi:hypothetical protein ACXYTJ_16180 [Gilvimarinus sp. F26214L]|uniref:hypothetical protein n=1 Tax=Gilvimarinus sp. DZF01 TaxID=3461371 RepID=UPI004045DB67
MTGRFLFALLLFTTTSYAHEPPPQGERRWLAGDHHVHSRYSVGWDNSVDPPSPILGADAIYPIPMNAVMARRFGLDWMVSTDHGGPNHSKVNLEHAYPELQESRKAIPDLVQFYGMEFDTPGADHSSIIVPHSHDERHHLHEIESNFNKREPWPADDTWDTEPRMLEALESLSALPAKPVVIAHHPSRSAEGLGEYGMTSPSELRAWNDTAPDVAVGMEGAPGHQAVALMQERFGPSNHSDYFKERPRGAYRKFPTMGGYDQMTARLGGFWDSMLGEGRRWWITANSDSHIHWTDGGADFWPGEYSKTYVFAEKNHDSILDGIRHGRIFVTTGDLISELWFTAATENSEAGIGEALSLTSGDDLKIRIRFLDPEQPNGNGDNPKVKRVDLIVGGIGDKLSNPAADENPTTKVMERFKRDQWQRDGDYWLIETEVTNLQQSVYLRLRGTNTAELEPEADPPGEDPWSDLWFYSNPIFITVDAAR